MLCAFQMIKTILQPSEPEDEETKKYRLEIEKQKSMREKILRDKELRRRQAAEDKTKDEVSSINRLLCISCLRSYTYFVIPSYNLMSIRIVYESGSKFVSLFRFLGPFLRNTYFYFVDSLTAEAPIKATDKMFNERLVEVAGKLKRFVILRVSLSITAGGNNRGP